MSLLVVERGMPGFDRGRNLDKIGLHAQDTAELFFTDVRVPAAEPAGRGGPGFAYLVTKLPQERLSIAVAGVAAARAALDWTLEYVQAADGVRRADRVVPELAVPPRRDGHRDRRRPGTTSTPACGPSPPASSPPRTPPRPSGGRTELQGRVVDGCVQLHGGYGYMTEYPIARAYADARVTRIYGGTTEIMKEIVGRSLGV